MSTTPERVVADLLYQHRHRCDSLNCAALDWTYDGENDHMEHQADRIVAALRSAGYLT